MAFVTKVPPPQRALASHGTLRVLRLSLPLGFLEEWLSAGLVRQSQPLLLCRTLLHGAGVHARPPRRPRRPNSRGLSCGSNLRCTDDDGARVHARASASAAVDDSAADDGRLPPHGRCVAPAPPKASSIVRRHPRVPG